MRLVNRLGPKLKHVFKAVVVVAPPHVLGDMQKKVLDQGVSLFVKAAMFEQDFCIR